MIIMMELLTLLIWKGTVQTYTMCFISKKGSYDEHGPGLSRFYTNTSKTKYYGSGYKNQLTSLQPNESPSSLDTIDV